MTRGVDEFWAHVIRSVENLAALTYYDLLEVPEDVDGTRLSDAFRNAVRTYHPDRFATERDPRRVQALNRLFARINEAYRVLSNANLRAEYNQGLASGTHPTVAQPAVVRRQYRETRDPMTEKARVLYQRGIELTQSGELTKARAQLQLALQYEKSSPAILAALDLVNQRLAGAKK